MAVYAPKIKNLPEIKLIGNHVAMSLAENRISFLWQHFMPRRKEIEAKSTSLYSLKVYDGGFDPAVYNPGLYFKQWAALEVENFEQVPAGMGTLTVPAGLYAIFNYKGLSTDPYIFEYIFTEWLPNSAYLIDDRPHFEVLGEKYKNNDPESEEDIYIPVRLK